MGGSDLIGVGCGQVRVADIMLNEWRFVEKESFPLLKRPWSNTGFGGLQEIDCSQRPEELLANQEYTQRQMVNLLKDISLRKLSSL